jgi:hypothetical protein
LNPCDPQWAKGFSSLVSVFFLSFLLALKKEKDLLQFFSLKQFKKKKNSFSFQFGKVVRVVICKKEKEFFFKFFLIS